MDFAFSEEQQMLRISARDWLADQFPIERVVELAESDAGFDPATWAGLTQLGWLDPELTVLDTAGLFEEAGYALLVGPLFSSVALGVPGAEVTRPTTLAWAEPGAPRIGDPVATTADAAGRVTGHKIFVPDTAMCEVIHVVAEDGVYAVEAAAATVTPRLTLDRTRRLAEVTLDATPGERVAGPEVVAQIALRAGAAAACEAVGVARKMLDISAAHASTREQFGRIIGTYQGISHRVADMFVSLELARSLAYWASWAVSDADPEADLAVAAATTSAGAAAVSCCEAAIQIHGGLGMTWDSPIHRYYKRAQWLDAFAGNGRAQRRRIAAHVLAR
jgi:alkylation response protein AidB-like acyl-CoA dehydrogenase